MSLKVYYLDDEPDLTEIFSDIFNSDKILVLTFNNPQQAINKIKSDPPDLLFIDYHLPNTNGDQVAQLLDPSIPKAMITGNLSVSPTARFDRIFHKPFDLEALRSFIQLYLNKKEAS